jgi:hypothetical protein
VNHVLVAALMVALGLAGCAGEASGPEDEDAEEEVFDDLGLEATETTGVIRGVVVDQAIRPLAGANVTLTIPGGGKESVRTGEAGTFGFSDLDPGTYFVAARKLGYNSTQTAVEVVAGLDDPPVTSIMLEENPAETPYVQVYSYEGFITCGVAIVVTSVGCTTVTTVANLLGDSYIWNQQLEIKPDWAQGELVWDQTQPAGGYLIWEIVPGGTNSPAGYRETGPSPALAYWDNETIDNWWDHDTTPVSERGIN